MKKFKNLSKASKAWIRLSKAVSCTAEEFAEVGRRMREALFDYERACKVEEAKRLHAIGHRTRMKIIYWNLVLK